MSSPGVLLVCKYLPFQFYEQSSQEKPGACPLSLRVPSSATRADSTSGRTLSQSAPVNKCINKRGKGFGGYLVLVAGVTEGLSNQLTTNYVHTYLECLELFKDSTLSIILDEEVSVVKSVKQEHEGCLHHHQERLQLRHFPKALSFSGSQRIIFSAARGMSFKGNDARWAFTGGQTVVS